MTTYDERLADLREYFLGTYAEQAIQAAIESNNEELKRLAFNEYAYQRERMEEQLEVAYEVAKERGDE